MTSRSDTNKKEKILTKAKSRSRSFSRSDEDRKDPNPCTTSQTTSESTTMQTSTTSPEVDTHDTPPTAAPMHLRAKRIMLPPRDERGYATTAGSSGWPRLTLSAFRRPEHTVRLTRTDPSRLLEDEYNLHFPGCGILGHGAFSTVRLARRNRDGLKVAIKSIAKHDALRARRLRRTGRRTHLDEWQILQEMREHPYIVTLLDVFETDERIHLVTEYCEGGELFDAIQKKKMHSPAVRRGHYSEPQAACIARQLLTALRDLHARGIIHRDVKPENIVLVSDDDSNIHAKLCDFGMARVFYEGSPTNSSASDVETPPSTPGKQRSFCAISCDYYAAPEVCVAGVARHPSADLFSLAVIVYILLCGFPPIFSEETVDSKDYVLFPEVHWSCISDSAKDLIRKMLHPDPSKRITAEDALRDVWIMRHIKDISNFTVVPLQNSNQLTSDSSSLDRTADRINLEQVRSKLYQAMAAQLIKEEPSGVKKSRRASDVIVSPKRKRRRSLECHRRSSMVCAMKELYSDAAMVSAAANTATAGVVCNNKKKDVHVLNEELGYEDPDTKKDEKSPFKSPRATLSV